MSKSKSKKKKTVSTISPIKWNVSKDPGGRWANDHPMKNCDMDVNSRYKIHISQQQTPKRFGGIEGWNWTLRDRYYGRNIVLPNFGHKINLREAKRRSMLAYLLWFTVKLVRETDDPRVIDMEFFHV